MIENIELLDVPRLSIKERDSRWKRVREAMRREGVDCLVLPYNTGHYAQFQAETQYITHLGDFEGEVAAVFPLEGEVVAWVSNDAYAPFWRRVQDWVPNVSGCGQFWSEAILERLHELGMDSAHIGIVGLAGSVHAAEGFVDYHLVHTLNERLPQATFSNATPLMQRVRAVKSDDEVEALRRGVQIAEISVVDAARVAKPGVPDVIPYAEVNASLLRNGGWMPTLIHWQAGPEVGLNVYYPTNRPLQPGDIIGNEIEGKYLGYRGQILQPIAIGPFSDTYRELLKRSIDVFNFTAPLMKPGVTYGELNDTVIQRYASETEFKIMFNVQARGMGEDWPLCIGSVKPADREVQMEANNVLVIKHRAATPDAKHGIIWGETVVITPQGGVRLGTRPQGVLIAGGEYVSLV